ncbi:MAG: cytochrome c oxidase assembly protein [bacterium]
MDIRLAHGAETPGPVVPISVHNVITETAIVWWFLGLLLVAAGLYIAGVWRLRARGDRWAPGRTASFLLGGLGVIAYASMGGPGYYDGTVFSVHMVQHMLLMMVAPIFLALGAPVTLALRTLPRGGRTPLLALLHSRLAGFATFPLVGWLFYVASPFALYFTGWYRATLGNYWLHDAMHLHFVLVGCLFFWPMLGIDPIPGRVSEPFRFLIVVSTLPFHAILGLSIYTTDQLVAGDYYPDLHQSWLDPLQDQRVAGGLLWSSGELIGLILLAVIGVQWMRASEREAVREDRRLDRLEAEQARSVRGSSVPASEPIAVAAPAPGTGTAGAGPSPGYSDAHVGSER